MVSTLTTFAQSTTTKIEEEVIVTATRSETTSIEVPASTSVVTMGDAEKRGFLAGGDELRGEPGIFLRRGDGDNDDHVVINIRGITGNHGNDSFLAMIDGIPIVTEDEEISVAEIPYRAIERVEIVRGPMSALYGRGGIAGAINYITRVPSNDSTTLRLALGDHALASVSLTHSTSLGRKTRFFASLDGFHSDGWRAQNDYRALNAFLKGITEIGPRTFVTWYANVLDKDYETGSVLPVGTGGRVLDVRGGREGFIGSRSTGGGLQALMGTIRLQHQWTPSMESQTTAHIRRHDGHFRLDFFDAFGLDESRNVYTVNGYDGDGETWTGFVEEQWSRTSGRFHSVAGANVERIEAEETDAWSGQYGFTPECGFAFFMIEVNYRTGAVLNRDHPCFENALTRTIASSSTDFASVFAQTEFAVVPRVSITAGGRYDRFRRETDVDAGTPIVDSPPVTREEDHFSPKLSIRYELAPKNFVYASYGVGFSPNFGPVWQWDPTQYVRRERPTRLTSYEAGVKGLVNRDRLSYALAAFSIDQRDRLLFIPNPDAEHDFTAPPNIATTGQRYTSRGLEWSARYRVGGASAEVNYTYTEPAWDELRIDTFNGSIDLSGVTPAGVPKHMFSARLEHAWSERISTHLSWEQYGDYFVTLDNSVRDGGYGLATIGASWHPTFARLEALHFGVSNALDEEYFFFYGDRTKATHAVPGVPRQFRITASWSF